VKRALRILKKLTRVVGASRDLDVGLGLLEARLERPRSLAQRRLLQRLRAGRQGTRRRSTESALDLDLARLRRDLRKVIGRGPEESSIVRERVRTVREEEGPALVEDIETMAHHYDPEALHGVRRRARRLRYVAEVADALATGEDEAPSGRPWKKLQTPLGHFHDHVLLAAWLGRAEEAARAKADRTLAAEAAAQRAWAEAEARRIRDELVSERPREIVLHALEAMGASRTAA
jgi:CHAD domain-containing protein